MKITKITKIHNGLYEHICPKCGRILASASEIEIMPEFSICSCDRNINKIPAYELYTEDGYVMIRRNKFPRFTGVVTMGQTSDIERIQWIDECSLMEAARAMRKAAEFLRKSQSVGRN